MDNLSKKEMMRMRAKVEQWRSEDMANKALWDRALRWFGPNGFMRLPKDDIKPLANNDSRWRELLEWLEKYT